MGKMYLFLIPSKSDGRVKSQQGAPTSCNLTYWEVKFPSRHMYRHNWPVWVWSQGKIQTLILGGGAGQDNGCDRRAQFTPSVVKEHIAPILPIKYPQTARAYNTFHPGAYHYFHISQPAKNCLRNRSFAEQIHWVPQRYVICSSRFLSFFYSFIYYFYIFVSIILAQLPPTEMP